MTPYRYGQSSLIYYINIVYQVVLPIFMTVLSVNIHIYNVI